MSDFLTYLFWPNPGNVYYSSPKVMLVLVVALLMIVGSFVLSWWRRNKASAAVRKVSKAWAPSLLWFGLTAVILAVARVEQIQFVAMRFLWVIWGALALVIAYFQVRVYRNRYYEVLPTENVVDPRSKYLPKKKHR